MRAPLAGARAALRIGGLRKAGEVFGNPSPWPPWKQVCPVRDKLVFTGFGRRFVVALLARAVQGPPRRPEREPKLSRRRNAFWSATACRRYQKREQAPALL